MGFFYFDSFLAIETRKMIDKILDIPVEVQPCRL